jgi:glutamate 5-kinase
VRILGPDGVEVARGLAHLGVLEVAHAAGQTSAAIEKDLQMTTTDAVVVHRDDLVIAT